MTTGWYDLFSGASDMLSWYANLTVPTRLLVRPADHSEVEKDQFDLDFSAEAQRWFDYWLKGIDNGIIKEMSLHYYIMGAPKKLFRTGKRIRITVAWTDADNFETPVLDPAARVCLVREPAHPSFSIFQSFLIIRK